MACFNADMPKNNIVKTELSDRSWLGALTPYPGGLLLLVK